MDETIKITLRYEVDDEIRRELREAGITVEQAAESLKLNLGQILSLVGFAPASIEVEV